MPDPINNIPCGQPHKNIKYFTILNKQLHDIITCCQKNIDIVIDLQGMFGQQSARDDINTCCIKPS